MATVEAIPVDAPAADAPAARTSAQQRFLVENLGWDAYQSIAEALDELNVRINYDRGVLELMTLSSMHEWLKRLLAQFIDVLTLELKIRRRSAGSFTLRRRALNRGAESDDCFYIAHEPEVRGRDHINLDVDPPPDLGIEIEVSRSALDRMSIFAAIRVPEVWCYNGARLRVYLLDDAGEYVESEHSRCFPFLPLRDVETFLNRRHDVDEMSLVDEFRQWVRAHVAAWSPQRPA
ncbi:MAG TPA: Uma2 family endonuclease [Planctomycetaceae bacterium]|nr:Uma2 family endonuclease [Planctomycetaceae bacterium]